MQYPAEIANLIKHFSRLPGIGQKTAERLVFYILKRGDENDLLEFGRSLAQIKKVIKVCERCGFVGRENECEICQDTKRNKEQICLVAEKQDVFYIEKTGYKGVYHILGGVISPAGNITPEKLNIASLTKRIEKERAREIIFGLNPTIEGETTILYLKKAIQEKYPEVTLTRLSRGLPMGGDIEYADEITLSSALNNRTEV